MTKKIFIDTNKYLDFYRYKNENLEILNKLQNCKDIILVEQVVDEFKRNRNKEIVNLINKVKEVSSRINNNTLNIEPFGIYNEQIKQINNLSTKNIQEIKDNISNFQSTLENTLLTDETDIVYTTFKKIISNSTIYKHDMESYNKAIIRNNLGGIPRSDRMGFRNLTICDEYIWETLLKNSKNDICFITRDKTYLENIN
ncbi:MAG: DUF4935 domain-containing protein, partial [Clostridia bacterium]|nr:DUF4935 domain-containing protein [Clostridia bacterium]